MKSERPLGLHLTIRKALVMLGKVVSVCGGSRVEFKREWAVRE